MIKLRVQADSEEECRRAIDTLTSEVLGCSFHAPKMERQPKLECGCRRLVFWFANGELDLNAKPNITRRPLQ